MPRLRFDVALSVEPSLNVASIWYRGGGSSCVLLCRPQYRSSIDSSSEVFPDPFDPCTKLTSPNVNVLCDGYALKRTKSSERRKASGLVSGCTDRTMWSAATFVRDSS